MGGGDRFTAGQVVAGRYRLDARIGKGGMGTVWRAHDLVDGRDVALKLVDAGHGYDAQRIARRFFREADVVAALEHEHIVRVHDYGIEAGQPYMAMELLVGESLSQRLQRVGRMSPAEAARIVGQAAEAIAHAHAAGVVHRDLKPGNLFLQGEVVKVLDFGIVKLTGEPGAYDTLTETGAVLGTPHYMSPEQARGQRTIDHRTDLWSLGVIAFRCITGVLPFRGAVSNALVAICTGPVERPSEHGLVPDGLDAWFVHAVARDPEQRFQSARELAAELSALCAGWDEPIRPVAGSYDPNDVTMLVASPSDAPASHVGLVSWRIADELQLMQRLGRAYADAVARIDEVFRHVTNQAGGYALPDSTDLAVFPTVFGALDAAVELRLASEQEGPRDGGIVDLQVAVHAVETGARGLPEDAIGHVRQLCGVAHPGQVLASNEARGALELPRGFELVDLGPHTLALGSGRSRVFQVVAPELPSAFPPLRTIRAAAHNLPAEATSFVGRATELRDVLALIRANRMVTLTGPGGAGKSRLAMRAGMALLGDDGVEGVYLVPLTAVRDARLVLSSVAGALGVTPTGQQTTLQALAGYLAPRAVVLVVDNFEQVREAAVDLQQLLDLAPRLRLLVTSRVPLGLEAERLYDVPLLRLPDGADIHDLDRLRDTDAIALFVSRARRVDPRFDLDHGNAPEIVTIVRRLEGLPLAIELAAARIRMFTPAQLARRLRERRHDLRDDTGSVSARHRALRDVIAWSVELLDPADRTLFRRLGAFVGGFTVATAERVAGFAPVRDVSAGIASLVRESLVRREVRFGHERFAMLETVRQFAVDELGRGEEAEAVQQRHLDLCVELAEELAPDLTRQGSAAARERLTAEEGNLRAALDHALRDGAADEGLRIASGVWRWWQALGRLQEGRRWLVELLARPEVQIERRAAGLSALAGLAYWQADYDTALERYAQALALYRDLGDRLEVARTLFAMSTSATWSGDTDRGEALAREALALFERLGAREQVGMVHMAQGFARWMKGDLAGARPLWESSVAIAREAGDHVEAAHKCVALAGITWAEGRHRQAVRDAVGAMDELFALGNVALTVMALDFVASMAVGLAPDAAVQLAAAATQLRRELGGGMRPEECGLPNVRDAAAERLAPEALDQAWSLGARLDLPAAVQAARRIRDGLPT